MNYNSQVIYVCVRVDVFVCVYTAGLPNKGGIDNPVASENRKRIFYSDHGKIGYLERELVQMTRALQAAITKASDRSIRARDRYLVTFRLAKQRRTSNQQASVS